MNNFRNIKKYENRKLYDVETSRYVTLANIETMLKSGISIAVTDNETKKDITNEILVNVLCMKLQNGDIHMDVVDDLLRGN